MKRCLTGLLLAGLLVPLAGLGTTAGAQVGQLTPTVCAPPRSMFSLWFNPQGDGAPARTAKGLTHPNAVWFHCASIGPIPSQRIAVAIDSQDPQASTPDVMRLDMTNTGDFTEALSVALEPDPAKEGDAYRVPLDLVITREVDGQQVPGRIQGTYVKHSGNYRELKIKYGTCLQGLCQFGPKAYPIQIRDGTLNWSCRDRATVMAKSGKNPLSGKITPGDVVNIDTGDGTFSAQTTFSAYLGQPIWLDGAWYDVQVSEDGTSVSAQPLDLPTGAAMIPNGKWEMILLSEKYPFLFNQPGDAAEIRLPAGQYAVTRYKQFIEFPVDAKGALLVEPGSTFAATLRAPRFEVVADQTTQVPLGTPISPKLSVQRQKDEMVFKANLQDAGGTAFSYRGGGATPNVKLLVKDSQGKLVHRGSMEFG